MSVLTAIKNYNNKSKGLLYSYLICLPLLLLYELLILISQPETNQIVRVSVDVWFKQFFLWIGVGGISGTLYVAAIVGAVILYRAGSELKQVRPDYFFWMLIESLLYAIIVSSMTASLVGYIVNMAQTTIQDLPKLQLLALSLGAGLYEELFFRVILVGTLLYVFKKIFSSSLLPVLFSVIIAAFLFSGVHYIGEFSDPLELSSFLFRFLFGLALNLIYVIRGFGLAAWTHAIYDILVVMFMS